MNSIDYWRQQWNSVGDYSKAVNYPSARVATNFPKDEVNEDAPCPLSDSFLQKAQSIWFPSAPMDVVGLLTIEQTPKLKDNETWDDKGGVTKTNVVNNHFTKPIDVYINGKNVRNSQRRLYHTLGHELVHVSQYKHFIDNDLLAKGYGKEGTSENNILEYHAYLYQHHLGGPDGGFTIADAIYLHDYDPEMFHALNWINFKWAGSCTFKIIK